MDLDGLSTNQKEADTRMMLYVKQTSQRSNSNVVVYTPGTDVFNTSLASSHIANANLFIRTVKLTKITNQI